MKGISLKNEVSLDDLRHISMPEETSTYVPVSHFDLATNINKVANDMLCPHGYTFKEGRYGTARDGQRMFGLLSYKNGGNEMGCAVGFRNSYDKSMSAGMAVGGNVFVCDNLMFCGEVCVMRKHTKNVKDDLTKQIVGALYSQRNNFEEMQQAMERLKSVDMTDDEGYRMLGLLAGRGILSPTLLSVALKEWKAPMYTSFEKRSAWSLFNAVTESMKKLPPHQVFEKHIAAHEEFKELGEF